jgi:hypothetical protein
MLVIECFSPYYGPSYHPYLDTPLWGFLGLFILSLIVINAFKSKKRSKLDKSQIDDTSIKSTDIFGLQQIDKTDYSNYRVLNVDLRIPLFLILTIISFSVIINKNGKPIEDIEYSDHQYFYGSSYGQYDYYPKLYSAEEMRIRKESERINNKNHFTKCQTSIQPMPSIFSDSLDNE